MHRSPQLEALPLPAVWATVPSPQLTPGRHATPAYRADLDGLRALAIVAVLGFHGMQAMAPAGGASALARRLLGGGFAGVDVFFVISGYLITGGILRGLAAGTFQLRAFFLARIRRLFPALVCVLAATWLGGLLLLYPDELVSLSRQIEAGSAFVANFYFYSETNYFSGIQPMLHLWSLAVEEQFYLGWPLLLLGAFRWKKDPRAMILLATLGSFALNIYLSYRQPLAAFYFPGARLWELLLGALLAERELRGPVGVSRRARNALALAGAGALALAFAFAGTTSAFPGWIALLPTGGALALIAAGPAARINRAFLSPAPMVYLGRISYPLYLWHWPLLSMYVISRHELTSLSIAALLGFAFLLAALTYEWIERPVRRWTARGNGPRSFLAITGALALVFLLAFASSRDGFLFRIPPDLRVFTLRELTRSSTAEWRRGSCFLGLDQRPDDFSPACADTGFRSARDSVMIWGDSFGAMLVPGFTRGRAAAGLRVAQYTVGGCPPVPKSPDAACARMNAFILARAAALRPKTVILAANWMGKSEDFTRDLAGTVESLHQIGIRNIVLLGRFPKWSRAVPRLLLDEALAHPGRPLPETLPLPATDEEIEEDQAIRSLAAKTGARFFSPRQFLCVADRCRALFGPRSADLAIFDFAHLTPVGAERLDAALWRSSRH